MSSKKVTNIEIKEFDPSEMPMSCTWIIIGPPASGKCLGYNTPVLLYNGNIKPVQDITTKDLLMGDDSTPRRVLGTTTGRDRMYRITPIKGESYTVNEPHVLCLKRNFLPQIKTVLGDPVVVWMKDNKEKKKRFNAGNTREKAFEAAEEFLNSLVEGEDYTRENILEISVRDYLQMAKSKKAKYKGYKVGVEFKSKRVPFDPWLLGYWLGDGTSSKTSISTQDPEVIAEHEERLIKYGLSIVHQSNYDYRITSGTKGALPGNFSNREGDVRNPMLTFLRDYNLLDNKHIPDVFKINDRQTRLQVLAGLIDSDGHLANDSYFEIVQKSEKLANDIVYLARSLGFYCSKSEVQKTCTNAPGGPKTGTYFRMNICGKRLCDIPTILPRKQFASESDPANDPMVTGITVEYVGEDDYYGFELDDNHRFLLGDFTVTHNTSFMENMAYYRKHLYPVGRVFIGTEDGYKRFCKIFHPLYVSNYWDEKEEERHCERQRTCEMQNGRGYPGNYAINIIDDVSDDPKIYKTKLMRGIFKLGSQHWAQLAMVGSQYAIDMPPDIRKAVSYVALGREPEPIEREKLYKNFGGLAGSYDKFCDLMDQITGDYTFLIFKKRSQSNELEECVSWFRTKKLSDWKFGCKEYRAHGDTRYDTNYVETITM